MLVWEEDRTTENVHAASTAPRAASASSSPIAAPSFSAEPVGVPAQRPTAATAAAAPIARRVKASDKRIINGATDVNQLVPFKYKWAWELPALSSSPALRQRRGSKARVSRYVRRSSTSARPRLLPRPGVSGWTQGSAGPATIPQDGHPIAGCATVCRLRARGFSDAGIPDPTVYAVRAMSYAVKEMFLTLRAKVSSRGAARGLSSPCRAVTCGRVGGRTVPWRNAPSATPISSGPMV